MSSTGVRSWFVMASTVAGCLLVAVSRARAQQGSAGPAPVTIVISGQITAVRSGAPLAGTDVTVVDTKSPAIGAAATADSAGRFSIAGLTPGEYAIHLHRVGYATLDTTVTATAGDTLRLAIQLHEEAVGLPRVTVTGESNIDPRMMEFEMNRKKGFGRFLTREQLDKARDKRLSEVLSQLSGNIRIERGPDGHTAHVTNRAQQGPAALTHPSRKCFVQLVVDGTIIYGPNPLGGGGTPNPDPMHSSADPDPNPPPDINLYRPESLEGVAFYSSPSSTPVEYRNGQSECGTLVLWTRTR